MRNYNIVTAYDKAAPSDQTAARIYANVIRAGAESQKPVKTRRVLRRGLLIAACVALVLALAAGGYAAYQKWSLPAPQAYTPPESGGFYLEHGRQDYTAPAVPDPESTGESDPEPESLSDEAFLLRSLEILQQAGLDQVPADTMTVVRQKHLYWNREEAVVLFNDTEVHTSFTFDAETGVFIGMSGIDWVLDGASACATQGEADALALRYYQSLPVEQGYVMRSCEKYDEQFWSYDFCREAAPGIYSSYECVRVSINPVSGKLVHCTVFYVPLLDDHAPGDVPLTQAQAEAAAAVISDQTPEERGYVLTSAEVRVCLPNWMFTDRQVLYAQASDVTRLCWYLEYEKPNSEFSDCYSVMVDYYTGEILGGDVVG